MYVMSCVCLCQLKVRNGKIFDITQSSSSDGFGEHAITQLVPGQHLELVQSIRTEVVHGERRNVIGSNSQRTPLTLTRAEVSVPDDVMLDESTTVGRLPSHTDGEGPNVQREVGGCVWRRAFNDELGGG